MLELLRTAVQYVLHLDTNLQALTAQYGVFIYGILFVIVFAETGFVVTPFLPGDSLLFTVGALAASGSLNGWTAAIVLLVAAIAGDALNYTIGHFVGPKVFSRPKSLLFNPEHLQRAHRFYERYGGKTIILARFIPIIRTFAPFVAGIGSMSYPRFALYNVTGAVAWVAIVEGCGYLFGNLKIVKDNFTAVILAIIVISVLPAIIEYIRQWREHRREKATS